MAHAEVTQVGTLSRRITLTVWFWDSIGSKLNQIYFLIFNVCTIFLCVCAVLFGCCFVLSLLQVALLVYNTDWLKIADTVLNSSEKG